MGVLLIAFCVSTWGDEWSRRIVNERIDKSGQMGLTENVCVIDTPMHSIVVEFRGDNEHGYWVILHSWSYPFMAVTHICVIRNLWNIEGVAECNCIPDEGAGGFPVVAHAEFELRSS